MNTIIKDVFIPDNHKLDLSLDLPPNTPTGEAVVTVTVRAKNAHGNRMAGLEGKYKGQIWMANDFEAPLEDFAEYM